MSEKVSRDSADRRLEGWKEIAEYLGRTERQVQRWERVAAMPVRREVTGSGPKVYALRSELDAWRATKQRPPTTMPEPVEAGVDGPEGVAPDGMGKGQRDVRPWLVGAVVLAVIGLGVGVRQFAVREPSVKVLPPPSRPWTRYFWQATAEGGGFPKIKLPERPESIVVAPDNSRVYVTVRGKNLLMEVDTGSFALRTIPLPAPAWAVTPSGDGKRLFVGSIGGGLFALDTATRKVEWTVPANGPIRGLAVTPDGRYIYAAMVFQGAHRLEVATKQWKQLTSVGSPTSVDLDPTGQRLMIGYMNGGPTGRDGHDAVEVLDVKTERRVALFSGPPLVGGDHRWTADGNYLWLDGADACTATHYDHEGCASVPSRVYYLFRVEDQRIVKSIGLPMSLGDPPRMLPDRGEVFSVGSEIHSFDTSRLSDIERFAPGPFLWGVALSADGQTAYLVSRDTRELWVMRAEPDECTPRNNEMSHFFAMDGTGNDNLGSSLLTSKESLRYAPGFVGQALEVGISRENPQIRSKLSYPGIGQRDFTVNFYIKPLSIPDGVPLMGVMKEGGAAWLVSAYHERIQVELWPIGARSFVLSGSAKLPLSEWTAVGFTKGKGAMRLYVNGKLIADTPVEDRSMEYESLRGLVHIGGMPTTAKRLHALIDEMAIWPRVLSADEMRDIYARRTRPECRPAAAR